MHYYEFVQVYEALASTTKKLEKVEILSSFLHKLKGKAEWIYLLRGKVFPDYDAREFGISDKLVIKAVSKSAGINPDEILKRLRKIGDLGEIAEELTNKKKQSALFSSKLTVDKVFNNLRKITSIEGKGAVEKKLGIISELLASCTGKEAKYIVRTLLSDLRIGVADALLIDAISKTFFPDENAKKKVEEAYELANDFALVYESASKGVSALEKITVKPGKPIKVMLAVKADNIEEAFRICEKPAAVEYKYDGFRMIISKDEGGIKLFTRRLEDVTKQFPDIVEAVKKHVKGNSFILDSEVVGYDSKTKKYKPFEAISQRIKRKYDIEKLSAELPVEANIFDIIYYNGKNLMNEKFKERRKIVEKIISKNDWMIKPAVQLIANSEAEAMKFYSKALKAGEEGIIMKNLEAFYRPGRKVGYMAKMKPSSNEFDLVIVGSEYGSGKRAGWLTSYIVACSSGDDFLEVGKVSSGLKEKEEEGLTYEEMTNLIKPLIENTEGKTVKVKPKIVVTVVYQNIQKSPAYSSGFALRFPRITHYRPDRSTTDIASLDEIKKEVKKARK